MKKKLPKNPSLLGFNTQEDFSETSKKSILSMVQKKEKKKSIYQLLPWTGLSAAAIVTLFFALQESFRHFVTRRKGIGSANPKSALRRY